MFRFFEVAYLVIGVISILEVVKNWEVNRNRSYLFLVFALVSVFMFFFRRHYRQKFEQRKKNQ